MFRVTRPVLLCLFCLSASLFTAGSLFAQALKVRVSVKIILDENGNRPADGILYQDAQIEDAVLVANELLELNEAEWRFDLLPIIDLAGIPGSWRGIGCVAVQRDIEVAAASNPSLYAWREDAINVYVVDDINGGGCTSDDDNDPIVVNNTGLDDYRQFRPPPYDFDWTFANGSLLLHEVGHFFNLCHTHGCCCNHVCLDAAGDKLGGTPRGDDGLDDTLPDLDCWSRDSIANWSFGSNWADLNPEVQEQVDVTWLNVMSYHQAGKFTEERAYLTRGQLDRVAAEMHPVTGRRTHVLNLIPPEPVFSFNPTEAVEGELVEFDARASRAEPGASIVSWEWDLGDGNTDTGETVSHAYDTPGLYDVRLLVTDDRDVSMVTHGAVLVNMLAGDVTPWTADAVGNTGVSASARFEENKLLVFAGGTAFQGVTDNFHFVHQEFEGNTVITARILGLSPTDAVSAVGLMLRESLDPGSKHASIFFNQGSTETNMKFIRRRGTLTSTTPSDELDDTWVRIERQGSDFIGYHSDNGILWTQLGSQTIDMPATLFGGIAVSAINGTGNEVVVAEVSNVYIGDPPDPRYIRGDGNGDGRVNIADPSYIAGTIFGLPVAPITCEAAADANGDGEVNIADPTYIANFLFGIGPAAAPPAPYPDCGVVPEEEPLSCLGTEGCIE